ncbi:MAG: GDSL-type esterase/lipase family protein [Dysgonomonas sp.]
MNEPGTKNYFFYIFFTLLLAVCIFFGLKNILPERLFPENQTQSPNIVIDSLALNAMNESEKQDSINLIGKKGNIVPDSLEELASTKNMEGHINIIDFYEKLYQLENSDTKKEKVRIAYFGDSMTDGDLIVQDIRRMFQQKYGGEGVGFVGITSLSATSRYSVGHKFSSGWKTYSFLRNINSKVMFGIDGQVSFAKRQNDCTLEYKANDLKNCQQLNIPTLFYGKSNNEVACIEITINKDSTKKINLNAEQLLNTVTLATNGISNIKLRFINSDSIPFYGINFDNKKGIHIDNFSMRGNSGLPLSLLNTQLMQSFDKALHYDLIILQYGANVLGYGTTDYGWYEKKMTAVVEHLHSCFPNADILIVSVADKASKQDMEMKTDKAVIPLINAQRKYAQNTNSAFINLFNLMGGEDSMVKWVEDAPSLANKDYTHFNAAGAKKIASLIYDEIDRGYAKYKKLKDLGK